MPGKSFFDTNILIYAVAKTDSRNARAEELLASGGVLSVQILNEFVAVARRRILMPWKDILEALDAFRVLCPSPLSITLAMHEASLKIAERYGYHIYDALVIAAAVQADCTTLYSEDLQNGQVIERKLTIRNPFI